MYAFFLLFLLVPVPAANVAASQTYHADLAERVERLERLVQLQDDQLQAERLENDRTKHEIERMKHEFQAETERTKREFEVRTKHMDREFQVKIELMKQDFDARLQDLNAQLETATGARRNRADDIDPLAPVVSQMSQQLTEVSAEMQAIKNSHSADIQALQTAVQGAGSSVYVHWGSSTCPASNSLVYSGVMGGSSHLEHVANYLCLTMAPVLSNHTVPSQVAHLYGTEYQTQDSHVYKDAVCSVCKTPRSSTVMIPATNACEAGWTKEYSGFLMADWYTRHVASEYICVDSKLESRPGSSDHLNGKMLFYTVTRCGSLSTTKWSPVSSAPSNHVKP